MKPRAFKKLTRQRLKMAKKTHTLKLGDGKLHQILNEILYYLAHSLPVIPWLL